MTDPPVVLIVEDEPDLRSIFAGYLRDKYRVRTAGTVEEAMDRLDGDVMVVLLDRNLPERSGDDLLPHADRHDAHVAMVTGVEPEFDIIEMAIDAYVTKPVSREELREVVDHLLQTESYNAKMTEYLSLVRKKAILQAEKSDRELEESEEFTELNNRLQALQNRVDTLRDELMQTRTETIFNSL